MPPPPRYVFTQPSQLHSPSTTTLAPHGGDAHFGAPNPNWASQGSAAEVVFSGTGQSNVHGNAPWDPARVAEPARLALFAATLVVFLCLCVGGVMCFVSAERQRERAHQGIVTEKARLKLRMRPSRRAAYTQVNAPADEIDPADVLEILE